MGKYDIYGVFTRRGWNQPSADLYFDGNFQRRWVYPHLHMQMFGERNIVPVGRDARLAISMLAFSRGGKGGGGITIIEDGNVIYSQWRLLLGKCNEPMAAELAWIMDYFTAG
ncbi:hypothetical protein GCM10007973_17720 [Polymorphobacter multimanifer]|uniref:Uncharacterized protein n=1 Tax=Polymorphobacter multimanifer TaxID=1070431 RepID=A0A841L469_9SPHN|nr:hypothetical protein [Polymorphobacter multimanifer]MBB6227220.1 hypothetical protein [Polymorphobacter multimanifer]GGI81757.1 hypothetical protein GCM10007973_17720 [Polymorphobacter multimanifer]